MFIAAFYTAKHLFGFTLGLSRSLQGSTLDVIEAYKHISVVRDQLKDTRKNTKTVFSHSVYEKIKRMADTKMTIPRTCGRQTLRNNTNAKTPVAYFRCSLFLSFLDNLLQQIDTHFNGLSEATLLGLLLILANLQKLQKSSQEKVIQHYSPDIPSPSSASQELELWKRFWYGKFISNLLRIHHGFTKFICTHIHGYETFFFVICERNHFYVFQYM